MNAPKPTLRLRLDARNPGHFFACCGLLELADRAWGGAEGWFEAPADFFCLGPIDVGACDAPAEGLLNALRGAALENTVMTSAQIGRLAVLKKGGRVGSAASYPTARIAS